MKRTIYDCWNCRHSNSDNPYGIDYCEAHDTRCTFAHDDCDNFEPDTDGSDHFGPDTDGNDHFGPTTDGNDRHQQPPRRLTLIGWYLLVIAIAVLIGWLLLGCTTTKYVPVTETHTEHHWHTDSVRERDSTHTERETVIREVDSAAMARYGIQMESNQRAWLVLQREMENRLRELKHMTAQHDTINDSIPYPVEVIKEVPAKLTWWQQTRLHLVNILLYLLLAIGIIYIGRRHLKKYMP